MKTERPLRKWDVRALHNAAYGDRESLLTRIAVQQARAMALAIQAINLFGLAAMRTERPIGPAQLFEVFAGFIFVLENRVR